MPIQYDFLESQLDFKCTQAYKIPDKITQIWCDSVMTILKPKTLPIPTSDEIEDTIKSLLKKASFSDNTLPISLHLVIGLPKVSGGISEITEEWILTYHPGSLTVKERKPEPYYRSRESTLLYQSIYTFVKQMPLDKKLTTEHFKRDEVQFRLSLSQALDGEFINSTKSCDFLPIFFKKDRLTISVLYLEQESKALKEPLKKLHNPKVSIVSAIAPPQPCLRAPTPVPEYIPGNGATFTVLSSSPASNRISESFVGSYEESLLSGRMSTLPSKPITGFVAKVGILSRGRCPPHFSIPFSPSFYEHRTGNSSPYVGNVPLSPDGASEFRVPSQGQLQVVVINPNATAVQLFLIPYDLRDMPPNTKTFLRHRIQSTRPGHAPALRQAIHVQFARFSFGAIYLYHTIKVAFSLRILDDDRATTVTSLQQPPPNLRFTSLPKIKPVVKVPVVPVGPVLKMAGEDDAYLGYK